MTYKNLTRQIPFRLVYGHEDAMPIKHIVPILRIVVITEMTDVNDVNEILPQLVQLEEECFAAGFHQNVEKQRQKAWHY